MPKRSSYRKKFTLPLQPIRKVAMDHSQANHVCGSEGSDAQRRNHESNSAKAKSKPAERIRWRVARSNGTRDCSFPPPTHQKRELNSSSLSPISSTRMIPEEFRTCWTS
ncbi:hypothetical protein AVEN_71610-1 [Araneus ventricosus]|uniref:Uncharacterized protein n=1 Tax=Araneus ventricosus TaxID=182803 RepID=A0A4Y2JJ81_ARAVE|nr:hypothetical protein AVEN_71610-1 [Araneus ventricosus]